MSQLHFPPDWQVPAVFQQRMGDTAGRQRAMAADGHLLLVLHEPPDPGRPERAGRLFWRSPDGAWRAKGLGDGPQALKRHVAEYADRVDELEAEWQSARTSVDYFALLRAIAPLHRAARNLHATLQDARTLVPDDRDLINLRDRVGEVERAVELLHGDVQNGLDFTIAYQAERQADRTQSMAVAAHRLNLLAAVFFPVATLGAVFGMNLAHGLDGWNTPVHFWGLLGVGLAVGLLLAQFIARRPPPVSEPATAGKAGRRTPK
jgi:CorA-like Mg2+ transporter protein